jgi:2-polyprenyl-3-methyl-5-hydroxy-6-metoxy-1,4-benzoquinol methylase
MNYNKFCPVCFSDSKKLIKFFWSDFNVIHCNKCDLDYCAQMTKKEIGGDSSPVHTQGIEMMANSFHITKKTAESLVIKRIKIYENYLGRKCENILEVGCGPGVFYEPFNKRSIEWNGIDINSYWKLFGEKNRIPISNKPLEQIEKKYDVIMAFQVLEHVENPIKFMSSIISKLKPGGIIHLELPNQNSLSARIRRVSPIISYDYGFVQPPMHLRAYKEKTLLNLFNNVNLEPKNIFVCGNTDKYWGQVRDYNLLQKILYTLSGKIGLGSLLIGLAQGKK